MALSIFTVTKIRGNTTSTPSYLLDTSRMVGVFDRNGTTVIEYLFQKTRRETPKEIEVSDSVSVVLESIKNGKNGSVEITLSNNNRKKIIQTENIVYAKTLGTGSELFIEEGNDVGVITVNDSLSEIISNSFKFGSLVALSSKLQLNIASWTDYFNTSPTISVGDRLVFDSVIYENLTGAYTATDPSLDTTNWQKASVMSRNTSNTLYLRDKDGVEDSIRLAINNSTDNAILETYQGGVWNPATLELGTNSLFLGPRLGITAGGKHILSEDTNNEFHFHAHSVFKNGLSQNNARILNAISTNTRLVIQSDNSGEFTGSLFDFSGSSIEHVFDKKYYIQTGSTAATAPLRMRVFEGTDDTGPVLFDQMYSQNIFTPNAEIELDLLGFIELDKGQLFYYKIESTGTFSFKTDVSVSALWLAVDNSIIREDDVLQTSEWISGDTFTKGNLTIQNKKVYVCNTTGIQSGTFASNIDLWDELSSDEKANKVQTTGLISGGVVSQATSTTVNVTSGSAIISNYTDPTTPIVTDIIFTAKSGVSVANIATDGTTLFYYDDNTDTLKQQLSTSLTPLDGRTKIFVGSVLHVSGAIVLVVPAPGNLGYDRIGAFKDFVNIVIGPSNLSGNSYTSQGSNLNLAVLGGQAFMLASNFRNDNIVPDIVTLSGDGTSSISFSRVYRSAGVGLNIEYDGTPFGQTTVNPSSYDDGSGTLQSVTAGYWTIQRIFRGRSGETYVAYGQQEFSTKALALEALGNEPFIEKHPLPMTLYRCSLAVVQGATDLSNTAQAEFFIQGSFRAGGAFSGTGTIPGITSPGGVNSSIQYNTSNTFDGNSIFLYNNSSTTNNLKLISPLATATSTGIIIDGSAVTGKSEIVYNENTDTFSIESSSTTPIEIKVGTSTSYTQTTGGVHSITSTLSDQNSLLSIFQSGTNGGSSQITVGNRNPNGNVASSVGRIYIDSTTPGLYFKISGTGTTGWKDLSINGDVNGPSSSTDGAVAVFDGTTGKLIKEVSRATLKEVGNDTELALFSGSATGNAAIVFLNSSSATRGEILYEESPNELFLTTFGGASMVIASNSNATLRSSDVSSVTIGKTTAGNSYTLTSGNKHDFVNTSADFSYLMSLQQTGTNGGISRITVGDRNPEGNVTGDGGALYIRDAGANSDLYIKRSDGGNTGWAEFNTGQSITTPSTTTDNAIVLWNGTGGDNIDDNSNLTVTSSASELYLRMRNPSATGIVGTWLVNSSNVIDGELSYDQQNNNVQLIAYNSAGLTIDSATTVDINAATSNPIIISNNLGTFEINATGKIEGGTVLADTSAGYSMRQNGTNGGYTELFIGTRDPEGNVASDGGALYIRDSGTSSAVYLKKTETVNTGWSKLADADDLITTPTTTTDNAIVLWNGVGGDNIDEDSNFTLSRSGNDISIILKSVTAGTGGARTIYQDSTGAFASVFGYDNAQNRGFINCAASNSGFLLDGKGLVDIKTTATNDVRLTNTKAFIVADSTGECRFSSTNADTDQGFLFEQTGSNGGSVRAHVGGRDPNGNVTGNSGDFYIRDGAGGTIYVKQVDGGTTGWTDLSDSSFDNINWSASVNRRYTDGRRTQNIGTAYTIFDAPVRNLQTTAGKFVPNVGAGTLQILDIDDTTNGDLYEVMFTGSISCLTGYDIYMRIVAFDGTNRVGYLGSVDDNSIQINDIFSNGSNFPQNICMVGIIRGPSSFVGGGTPGLRVEVRNTTATGQIFTNSCYFSARRIK